MLIQSASLQGIRESNEDEHVIIQNIDSNFKNQCIKILDLSKSQFRQDLFALTELNLKISAFCAEIFQAGPARPQNSLGP